MHENPSLYHHGVKGMRWGHRKQRPEGSPTRQQLREMDKAARAEKRAKTKAEIKKYYDDQAKAIARGDSSIIGARKRLEMDRKRYKEAKKKYKVDKHQIGKVRAKMELNKHRDKYLSTLEKSREMTSGEKQIQEMADMMSQAISNAGSYRYDPYRR